MTTFPIVALVALTLQMPQEPVVAPVAPAVAPPEFRAALDRYLELRRSLELKFPPPQVTADAAEIIRREQALRDAVRRARARARQGEVFTPAVSAAVSAVVAADRMQRSLEDQKALMSDVPLAVPGVNEPYPEAAPLGTFPPLLIAALPPLPDELEYRYMGRYLIIRDAKTNIVVDYLLELTPPRPR